MSNEFINILKEELQKPLPGKEAQLKMASGKRNLYNIQISQNTKESGILIPIFKDNNIFHTVLFKRTDYDGLHAGQVCFPGGKAEEEDNSPEDTAIREAWEEIGIEKSKVEIIGKLSPLHIPVSDYLVYPYIGFLKDIPVFKTDPIEVKDLIITPVKEFMNEKNIKRKIMIFLGQNISIPYYSINNFEIWGATAMIISEWIEILKRPNFQHINLYNADNAL